MQLPSIQLPASVLWMLRCQAQSPLAFTLDVVERHFPAERQTLVIVEPIVNSSVKSGHRLLVGDPGECGVLLRKEVSEHRVERSRAARVARWVGRKVRKPDTI